MVDTPRSIFPRPHAGQVARLLLESARQDPALIGRSHPPVHDAPPNGGLSLPVASDLQRSIQLPGATPYNSSHQLEDLVSIAVESAHQAEDAARQADRATALVRRGMGFCATLGILGLVVGIAAIADNHLHGTAGAIATVAQADVASVASAPGGPSHAGVDQPARAAFSASTPQPVSTGAVGPQTDTQAPQSGSISGLLIPSASAQSVTRTIVPPVNHAPPASDLAPWPNGRPVRYYAAAPRSRVVVPPFFVSLQRGFSALFRG